MKLPKVVMFLYGQDEGKRAQLRQFWQQSTADKARLLKLKCVQFVFPKLEINLRQGMARRAHAA
jgi:hypothetical protein